MACYADRYGGMRTKITCFSCSDVRYLLDQTYYPTKRPDSGIHRAWRVLLLIPGGIVGRMTIARRWADLKRRFDKCSNGRGALTLTVGVFNHGSPLRYRVFAIYIVGSGIVIFGC